MAVVGRGRTHTIDTAYFREIITPAQAYWLGFLAADLTVRTNGSTASLGLAAVDKPHVERFRSAIRSSAPIHEYSVYLKATNKTYPVAQFAFSSKEMMADLRRHGLEPSTKSQTLQPWSGPTDLRLYWWLGLWDGDGSFPRDKKRNIQRRWASIGGTRAVVDGFVSFVESYLGPQSPTIHYSTGVWHLRFRRGASVQIAKLLYGNPTAEQLALPRKLAAAKQLMAQKTLGRPFAGKSNAELTALKDQLGSWNAVARHLGGSSSGLSTYRSKLLARAA
jgi:hypothetical protein